MTEGLGMPFSYPIQFQRPAACLPPLRFHRLLLLFFTMFATMSFLGAGLVFLPRPPRRQALPDVAANQA